MYERQFFKYIKKLFFSLNFKKYLQEKIIRKMEKML